MPSDHDVAALIGAALWFILPFGHAKPWGVGALRRERRPFLCVQDSTPGLQPTPLEVYRSRERGIMGVCIFPLPSIARHA